MCRKVRGVRPLPQTPLMWPDRGRQEPTAVLPSPAAQGAQHNWLGSKTSTERYAEKRHSSPAAEPPVLGSLTPCTPASAALSDSPAPLLSAPLCVSHFHVVVWVCEYQCCCMPSVSHTQAAATQVLSPEREGESQGARLDRPGSRQGVGKPQHPAVSQGRGRR